MKTYPPLSAAEARDLRALAAVMIPASSAYGVPGADDELIFADILRSLERDTDDAKATLALLAELSGGAFADLAPARQLEVAMRLKEKGAPPSSRSTVWSCSATTATTG